MAVIKEDASPVVLGMVVNNIWSFGGPLGTDQLLVNPIAGNDTWLMQATMTFVFPD